MEQQHQRFVIVVTTHQEAPVACKREKQAERMASPSPLTGEA